MYEHIFKYFFVLLIIFTILFKYFSCDNIVSYLFNIISFIFTYNTVL